MAYVTTKQCNKCKEYTTHINMSCSKCSAIEKEEQVKAWESMSIEKKLTDLRERIEKLERGPAKY